MVHCTACRFTPDGVHLLVTSANSSKVAVFDVCTGVYVATIGDGAVKSPYDIDFASNGDILILDRYLQVSPVIHTMVSDHCVISLVLVY